jgi:integrase
LPATKARIRPSTFVGYRVVVEKQVVPRLGAVQLQQLTAVQLNLLYAELLASGRRDGKGGLSNRSVRICHTVIRKALADAVRWGLLLRNVAEGADPPRPALAKIDAAKRRKTWTADELRAFLTYTRSHRLYAALLLAATTGMRRGEILGLRCCDVDLERGRISITQTLIAPEYELMFSAPKTEKGQRGVALDGATTAALGQRLERLRHEREQLGLPWDGQALLFPQEDGSPTVPHLFTLMFKSLTRAAGLPAIRLHDIRHTYATLALQAGVHPKVVSERLGHSSISITLDTYSHVIPTLQESAAELVAAMVVPDDGEPSVEPRAPGQAPGLGTPA